MDARIAYANRVPANLDNAEALRDVVQVDAQQATNNPPYRPKFAYLNARTLMRFGQIADAEPLYRRVSSVHMHRRHGRRRGLRRSEQHHGRPGAFR